MLQSQHLKASICDVVFPLAVSASAIPSLVLACVVTIAWCFAAAVSKLRSSKPIRPTAFSSKYGFVDVWYYALDVPAGQNKVHFCEQV